MTSEASATDEPAQDAPIVDSINAANTVSHLSVKPPPCWTQDIELWLYQCKAQFCTRGIQHETTKFDYIIQALPPDVMSQLRSFILNLPSEQPFTRLKIELQQLHALSNKQRYRKIMHKQSLGDKKPSQFLQQMRRLVGDQAESMFFQEMFLEKLPPIIQTVLAVMPNTNTLAQWATVMDRMMETCAAQPSIVRMLACAPLSPLPTDSTLTQTVQALQQELRKLRLEIYTHSQSHSRSPSSTHSCPSLPAHSDDPELCWYHTTFGKCAERCHSPCKMVGNSRASE